MPSEPTKIAKCIQNEPEWNDMVPSGPKNGTRRRQKGTRSRQKGAKGARRKPKGRQVYPEGSAPAAPCLFYTLIRTIFCNKQKHSQGVKTNKRSSRRALRWFQKDQRLSKECPRRLSVIWQWGKKHSVICQWNDLTPAAPALALRGGSQSIPWLPNGAPWCDKNHRHSESDDYFILPRQKNTPEPWKNICIRISISYKICIKICTTTSHVGSQKPQKQL